MDEEGEVVILSGSGSAACMDRLRKAGALKVLQEADCRRIEPVMRATGHLSESEQFSGSLPNWPIWGLEGNEGTYFVILIDEGAL